jgi:phage shock protein C
MQIWLISLFLSEMGAVMKKIYRIEEDKKIAGICAGTAHLLKIDVTLVRLAFVFITVVTFVWPGIITYLAGWYLIPLKTLRELENETQGSK